jgi:hypothetical protein
MNNSFIALDNLEPIDKPQEIDRSPWLRQKEVELIKIIEALQRVNVSEDWSTLKSHIFEGVVEKLEKDMLDEAKKDSPDLSKLASLKGQFVWAKKYSDLDSLAQAFKVELQGIRQTLKNYGK